MTDLEFERTLVLSTSHLPKDEATQIDGDDRVLAVSWEHGWWIHVSEDASDDELDRAGVNGERSLPHLAALIRIARAEECDWLRLDSDGPHHPFFPRFSW